MAFEVSVLPGLPAYGEPATVFSATGLGTHSEGLVVSFCMRDSPPWIGNFVRGLTKFDYVAVHPNRVAALIVAGGQGYVIDPVARQLQSTIGGAIVDAFAHPTTTAIVLNHQNLSFESIGAYGRLWRSRQISWDGLRFVEVTGNALSGEAWRYDDTWHPFQLDLVSGAVRGGAYKEG